MKIFIKFGAAAGFLGLAVACVAYFTPAQVIVKNPDGTQQVYGAVSGPDMNSGGAGFTFDGVAINYGRKPFTTATTTVCAIRSPQATSTLRNGGVRMSVSTSTASVLTFAKASTAFATTTIIGSQLSVSANAQADFVASTTAAQDAAGATVFAPSTWFVVSMSGGTGNFSPVGYCHGDFVTL